MHVPPSLERYNRASTGRNCIDVQISSLLGRQHDTSYHHKRTQEAAIQPTLCWYISGTQTPVVHKRQEHTPPPQPPDPTGLSLASIGAQVTPLIAIAAILYPFGVFAYERKLEVVYRLDFATASHLATKASKTEVAIQGAKALASPSTWFVFAFLIVFGLVIPLLPALFLRLGSALVSREMSGTFNPRPFVRPLLTKIPTRVKTRRGVGVVSGCGAFICLVIVPAIQNLVTKHRVVNGWSDVIAFGFLTALALVIGFSVGGQNLFVNRLVLIVYVIIGFAFGLVFQHVFNDTDTPILISLGAALFFGLSCICIMKSFLGQALEGLSLKSLQPQWKWIFWGIMTAFISILPAAYYTWPTFHGQTGWWPTGWTDVPPTIIFTTKDRTVSSIVGQVGDHADGYWYVLQGGCIPSERDPANLPRGTVTMTPDSIITMTTLLASSLPECSDSKFLKSMHWHPTSKMLPHPHPHSRPHTSFSK